MIRRYRNGVKWETFQRETFLVEWVKVKKALITYVNEPLIDQKVYIQILSLYLCVKEGLAVYF
jgi:hypothetical protein